CSGAPSAASPSIVLTSCPSAITASVVQDFTALPSRCTTQAPHCEVSHPTWVPVSRRFSRRNCTSSVRGSTLAVTGFPFTISEILAISTLCYSSPRGRSRRIAAALHGSVVSKSVNSHHMGHHGVGQPHLLPNRMVLTLYGLGEIREELIRQFLCRAVDQALAELGQLAANLGFHLIAEQRAAVLVRQLHRGAALGKARDPALALARNLVAVGRVEIAQGHLALETRRDRPDLHFPHRAKAAVLGLLQLLAARDAGLEHLGIVELGPHRLAGSRKLDFPIHCHCHVGLPGSLGTFVLPSKAAAVRRKVRINEICDAYSQSRKAFLCGFGLAAMLDNELGSRPS